MIAAPYPNVCRSDNGNSKGKESQEDCCNKNERPLLENLGRQESLRPLIA